MATATPTAAMLGRSPVLASMFLKEAQLEHVRSGMRDFETTVEDDVASTSDSSYGSFEVFAIDGEGEEESMREDDIDSTLFTLTIEMTVDPGSAVDIQPPEVSDATPDESSFIDDSIDVDDLPLKKRKRKKEDAPLPSAKRSKNPYIIFCEENRQLLQRYGYPSAEVERQLGSMWKSLSSDKKQHYVHKAKALQEKIAELQEQHTTRA